MFKFASVLALAAGLSVGISSPAQAFVSLPNMLISESGKTFIHDNGKVNRYSQDQRLNGYVIDPGTGKRYHRYYRVYSSQTVSNRHGVLFNGYMVETGHGERCVADFTISAGKSGDYRLDVHYADSTQQSGVCTTAGMSFETELSPTT